MTDAERREAAAALLEAENTGRWMEPITLTYESADIDDAYDVGRLVTEAKVAAGRLIKGHKVGLTSKAMRSTTGASEPDYGTIFDDSFVDEGSIVSLSSLNRPLVEIEIVFVLAERLAGPDVTAADVIGATDHILPAVEIVDFRYSRSGKPGIVDSIADAASCGFVVLGGPAVNLADIDIRHVGGALYRNGEVEETGTAAAVMGNPVNAVAWLARKLDEFDTVLEPGHIVLSGSFIRTVPVEAGDSFVADFGPLGQIGLGFTT